MVPGLSVGADYYEVGNTVSALSQEKTSGTAYANYKVGNWKFGVFDAYLRKRIYNRKYYCENLRIQLQHLMPTDITTLVLVQNSL